MDTLVKENVKLKKNLSTKHQGNKRHYEKTKSKNNNRRNPAQRPRKYFQQNQRIFS